MECAATRADVDTGAVTRAGAGTEACRCSASCASSFSRWTVAIEEETFALGLGEMLARALPSDDGSVETGRAAGSKCAPATAGRMATMTWSPRRMLMRASDSGVTEGTPASERGGIPVLTGVGVSPTQQVGERQELGRTILFIRRNVRLTEDQRLEIVKRHVGLCLDGAHALGVPAQWSVSRLLFV